MFKDPAAGLMHAGIFWGFVLLTIGTANIVTGGLVQAVVVDPVRRRAVDARQRDAERRGGHRPAAIGWAFLRRLVTKPKRLTYNRDALIILSMIGGVVATELLAQAFEAAAYGDVAGRVRRRTPSRSRCARSSTPVPIEAGSRSSGGATSRSSRRSCCYLPFSKHLHIATSFPNIWFRKLAPRGELPKLDLEAEDASFGLRTLQDLGWKDLLDGFTCTECGRCQEACPAWNTGKPLNPKTLHHGHPRTCPSMPSTGSTSSRTRRSCARRTASTTRTPEPRRRSRRRSSTRPSRTTRSGTA